MAVEAVKIERDGNHIQYRYSSIIFHVLVFNDGVNCTRSDSEMIRPFRLRPCSGRRSGHSSGRSSMQRVSRIQGIPKWNESDSYSHSQTGTARISLRPFILVAAGCFIVPGPSLSRCCSAVSAFLLAFRSAFPLRPLASPAASPSSAAGGETWTVRGVSNGLTGCAHLCALMVFTSRQWPVGEFLFAVAGSTYSPLNNLQRIQLPNRLRPLAIPIRITLSPIHRRSSPLSSSGSTLPRSPRRGPRRSSRPVHG
jgi:hypothetical protein